MVWIGPAQGAAFGATTQTAAAAEVGSSLTVAAAHAVVDVYARLKWVKERLSVNRPDSAIRCYLQLPFENGITG